MLILQMVCTVLKEYEGLLEPVLLKIGDFSFRTNGRRTSTLCLDVSSSLRTFGQSIHSASFFVPLKVRRRLWVAVETGTHALGLKFVKG